MQTTDPAEDQDSIIYENWLTIFDETFHFFSRLIDSTYETFSSDPDIICYVRPITS